MKRLEQMKECLIACVQNQISGHLDQVDAKELGEAVDMIKDLEEAIYYHTITEAMKEKEEDQGRMMQMQDHQQPRYYSSYPSQNYYEPMYNNGGNSSGGRGGNTSNNGGGRSYYHDMKMGEYPRDMREGQSPMYRRMYMEAKEQHHDSAKQMKELENYMHELTNDMMEMIADSTTEEKQMLRQKITALAAKIK